MEQSKVQMTDYQKIFQKLEDMPQAIAAELHPYVVSLTPIDKNVKAPDPGHARNNTTYDGQITIHADYPYAERLLYEGWSDQLEAGVFEPKVFTFVDERVYEYVRKL